jgi:hypothetical protein
MIKSRQMLRGCAAGAFFAAIGAIGTATPAAAAPANAAVQTLHGTLTALNGSGARGTLNLQLVGDRYLTVQINANGLEPGVPHVGHIHGLVANDSPVNSNCPTTAQDVDHDSFVELAEGQVTYGPIIIPFGNVDPDMDGRVQFRHTFDLNDPSIYAAGFSKSDVLPLDLREVVLHGMTLQAGQGATNANSLPPNEADGTAGFKAVLPVTCGDIQNTGPNPLQFVVPPHHNH